MNTLKECCVKHEQTEISGTQVKLRASRARARALKAAGDHKGRLDAVDEALWYRRIDILDKIELGQVNPLNGWILPRPCT
ncbi:hypothetical protein [Pseudomonas putida]|uniref:Uncharacterized protein n=1 Tax=Pseudomonas putida TaxID=303 RepID=A0A8I1JI56_PSEPU|nr:hypothetical protein [Pseudomonas putida]MBI6882623.1 hypothetical protein [Pseudomonas putida]